MDGKRLMTNVGSPARLAHQHMMNGNSWRLSRMNLELDSLTHPDRSLICMAREDQMSAANEKPIALG